MPRRALSAEFVVSAVAERDLPSDGRPEVAMVGRSNVGKSSLINALVRKSVARTSASPGKTRQVNVYRVSPAGGAPFYLMDLPGYGHAGGGEKARREFSGLTALYFDSRTGGRAGKGAASARPAAAGGSASLDAVILAIDARHPGMASDVEAWRWVQSLDGVRFLLVATKVDKLSQSERTRLRRACERAFGQAPIAVSAVDGDGLDELWQQISL